MSKFLKFVLLALSLQPFPALAQPRMEYGFPISENPPGDLPCHMVSRKLNTLDLIRLCGTVPPETYSGKITGLPGPFANRDAQYSGSSSSSSGSSSGSCNNPDDRAADGSRCGARASSARPGGRP